jgi:hypothetical protein
MAYVSIQEFGDLIGKSHYWVHQYIKRGKIIKSGEHIDTNYIVNEAFLKKWQSGTVKASANPRGRRSKEVDESAPPEIPKQKLFKPPPEPPKPSGFEMDAELKEFELRKKKADAELAEEKLRKVRGEVIPSDLIKSVFERYSRSAHMAFKNAAENLLQEIQQLSGLSNKEMADLRSRIIPITNEGIKEAFETALSEVDLIVDEYSQKRGIGEKF